MARSMTEPEHGEPTDGGDSAGKPTGIRSRNQHGAEFGDGALVSVEPVTVECGGCASKRLTLGRVEQVAPGARRSRGGQGARPVRVTSRRWARGTRTGRWTASSRRNHGPITNRESATGESARTTVRGEWRDSGGTNRV